MQIKINHICPSFNNKIYQFLAEYQMELGNDVRVYYFRQKNTGLPNGDKKYVDGVNPFTFIDRFSFFLKEAKVLKSYKSLYKDNEFNIIHAHTLFTSGYIAYKIKKEFGKPYVVAVRGTDVNIFFKRRFYLRWIGMRIMQTADAIIFISKAHMNEVMNKYVSKRMQIKIKSKCHILPNGVDDYWHLNEFEHKVPEKRKIKLIYYGDIDKNKNLETTMKACELLASQGYEIEYKIIGKVLNKRLFKLIQSKKYICYVDFLPKEEIIKHLRLADIFIMPSFSETFGLSYVEAMSQGLPVIYSKGQGFDGIFKEGEIGYHVVSKDHKDIVNKIKKIIDSYSFLSKNCVQASRLFSWSKIVNEYQNIYYNVLK